MPVENSPAAAPVKLTRRQKQVFDFLTLTSFNEVEIGEKLRISSRTVQFHKQLVFAAFDVRNRIDLILLHSACPHCGKSRQHVP